MTESVTIARQYAQAVFEIAKESGALDIWSERLQCLAMISEDPEIPKILGNPALSRRQVVETIVSFTGEAAGNEEFVSLVSVLLENGRFGVAGQISEVFEQLKDADAGVKEAVIYSAFPIAKQPLDQLLKQCESHFGSRLRPRLEIDKSLIGGVKIVVDDRVLDVSVRGKLDAMDAALKKN
ncbi:MAG: F0F1 ATP synthase subunit delta [Candidatus Accumulibacter sp.]|jgi:F-type H+-transporting ATPase subunit delta|nr:F0F1 ATP synthase subunit delta [Accumulibacter sp.]